MLFIFQIFVISSIIINIFATDSIYTSTPIRKFIPINLTFSEPGNGIWGNGDDWNTKFATESAEVTEEFKSRQFGVDGTRAFYTKSNYEQSVESISSSSQTVNNHIPDDGSYIPNQNIPESGLPDDGRCTIGGIPFNFNSENGDDCIKFCPELQMKNYDISLASLKGFKIKNLYIMGTGGAILDNHMATATIKFYDTDENELNKYEQTLNIYDWYNKAKMEEAKGNLDSHLWDYKNYGVRNLDIRDGGYDETGTHIQCWRLNKFSDNLSGSFEDEQLGKINIDFNVSLRDSNVDYTYHDGCCFVIFAVTAEVEYDDNITLSDIKHDSFRIYCKTSGNKQFKIKTNSGVNNENMKTLRFPYTYSGANNDSTYYCTIYDPDKNAYYYFEVKTKKMLNLLISSSNKVYNGKKQQLIDKVKIIDTETNNVLADTSVYGNNEFKDNVYLRIESPNSNIKNYETRWFNLSNLDKLTAANAGTYYIYYYIEKDVFTEYDSTPKSALLTKITV